MTSGQQGGSVLRDGRLRAASTPVMVLQRRVSLASKLGCRSFANLTTPARALCGPSRSISWSASVKLRSGRDGPGVHKNGGTKCALTGFGTGPQLLYRQTRLGVPNLSELFHTSRGARPIQCASLLWGDLLGPCLFGSAP